MKQHAYSMLIVGMQISIVAGQAWFHSPWALGACAGFTLFTVHSVAKMNQSIGATSVYRKLREEREATIRTADDLQ